MGKNKALKIHEYHSIMNKNAQDIKSIHDRLRQKMGRKQKALHDMMQSQKKSRKCKLWKKQKVGGHKRAW